MQVSEIYDSLRSRFVEIQIYRSVVKDSTKEELKRLSEYIEQLSTFEDGATSFRSMQSMYFQELTTGQVLRYGFIKSSAEDQRNRVSRHKDRQYGWLLVEAYEEFEDFLELIYAYIGKNHRNAWYLDDYGRAKLPELDEKPFEWYLDAVRRKYGSRHRELLIRIRELYPELKSVEEKNIYNVHVRVAVELIENLRHRIVHSRGAVPDLDEFVTHILKRCGLWNNGKPRPGLQLFIKTFFRDVTGTHTIALGERRSTTHGIGLEAYYDVWDQLVGYLIAYAYCICTYVDPSMAVKSYGDAK